MRENLAHVFQEQAERFFVSQVDSYAIMQLDSSKVTPFEPFSSLRLLEKYGLKPNAEHYNIVYTDALPEYQNIHVFLESTYSRFNMDRPEDFKGHSLSVSDIVAIRQAGVVSCYYCDSIGFQKLFPHLWEIQETAERRLNQMMEELLAQNPAPDKATDPMAWVQHMNSLKAQAEETIFAELIYS